MEIVDTITVMTIPLWEIIVTAVLFLVFLLCFVSDNGDDDVRAFVGTSCFILFIVTFFVFIVGGVYMVPDHEEYAVRITDMPANEFTRNWEVTKEYKYTDVIQVKKKSGQT